MNHMLSMLAIIYCSLVSNASCFTLYCMQPILCIFMNDDAITINDSYTAVYINLDDWGLFPKFDLLMITC